MRIMFFLLFSLACSNDSLLYAQTNLALNRPAYASTSYPGYNPALATDGSSATNWQAFGPSYPQWITVDLGKTCALTQFKSSFLHNAIWYYRIEGSNTNDGSDWQLLVNRTSVGVTGSSITETISGNYQYIRLYFTNCSAGWANSKELEIQGKSLAFNGLIDASSNDAMHLPALANDDNLGTEWQANDATYPQWITVDLGRICNLMQLKNTFANNATWKYKIEASNTNSVQDFFLLVDKTGSGAAGQTITETISGNYRYVRLYITACSSGGVKASSQELKVEGRVLTQTTGVVPAINAASSGSYLVGAQMCNLWGSKYHWDVIRNPYIYNGREPVMGWHDESYDISTDWTIKMARDHGITFFLPCWFRGYNNAGKSVISQYDQFINSIANTAPYRDSMKWAIQWVNDVTTSGLLCSGVNDFTQNIVPFWINNYFKKSNYLKIGNKPLVSIYDATVFVSNCGGTSNASTAITSLRTQCVSAGFSGVILMTAYHSRFSGYYTTSAQIGDSIGVDLGYSYHLPTFTELPTALPWTVAQTTGWQKLGWSNYTNYSGSPYVTSISVGWDSAPWGGFYGWQSSPAEYTSLLQDAKTRTDSQTTGSIQRSLILLDDWNEYGEGHYIAPTQYYRYDYLDAVRSVFTSGGAHTDSFPTIATIPQLEPIAPINLALGKIVSTSTYYSARYEGSKAVDASLEYTSWVAAGASFPQWIKVDLGSSNALGKVKSIFYQSDTWKYKIEGSTNNSTWTTLADNTGSGKTGQIIDDSVAGSYRYVKLTITAAANNWAAMKEIEIYNNTSGARISQAINLTGKKEDNQNVLFWKMSGDPNDLSYFEVKRSADKMNFEKINSQKRVWNKDIVDYSFIDDNPSKGNNFYQVSVMENGNSRFLSNVVELAVNEFDCFSISFRPNPASNKVKVRINGEKGEPAKLEIMNINGVLIQTISLNQANQTIDIGNLAEGLYLFKYSDSKYSTTEKVLKQPQ